MVKIAISGKKDQNWAADVNIVIVVLSQNDTLFSKLCTTFDQRPMGIGRHLGCRPQSEQRGTHLSHEGETEISFDVLPTEKDGCNL